MFFPLYIDLSGKRCLVVGAGEVGLRKAAMLRDFGAEVTIVAPEISGRGFIDSDVDGMALVIAATDDENVNAVVQKACVERSILVNVVDDPTKCSFIFPAILRKGSITVAISTDGNSPTAAKILKTNIAKHIADDFAAKIDELGTKRAEIKRAIPDEKKRREWYEKELAKWKE